MEYRALRVDWLHLLGTFAGVDQSVTHYIAGCALLPACCFSLVASFLLKSLRYKVIQDTALLPTFESSEVMREDLGCTLDRYREALMRTNTLAYSLPQTILPWKLERKS